MLVSGIDTDSFEYGPPLLYLSCLVPNAEILVEEMLENGGNPQAEWALEADWDPDDSYMSTDTVEVFRSIRSFHAGVKDYLHLYYLNGNIQPQM